MSVIARTAGLLLTLMVGCDNSVDLSWPEEEVRPRVEIQTRDPVVAVGDSALIVVILRNPPSSEPALVMTSGDSSVARVSGWYVRGVRPGTARLRVRLEGSQARDSTTVRAVGTGG